MGVTKTIDYSKEELKVATYAKALAHPARVAILTLLLEKKSCICSDIVYELPIAQSTVSQHLKALKEAGLIKGEIEGASVCYCIDEAEWGKAKIYMANLFELFTINKSTCC